MQERSPGLYVHVPFCEDLFPPFGTLYVGGGTPSLLGRSDLERLVRNIIEMYTFEAGFEFTLEANPDDLTQDKLGVLRDLGVNRLSIGVQSFDDAELRLLGRRHDAASALGAVEAARRAGRDPGRRR